MQHLHAPPPGGTVNAVCLPAEATGNETPEAAYVLCARFRVSPNACGSEISSAAGAYGGSPHLRLGPPTLIPAPVQVFVRGAGAILRQVSSAWLGIYAQNSGRQLCCLFYGHQRTGCCQMRGRAFPLLLAAAQTERGMARHFAISMRDACASLRVRDTIASLHSAQAVLPFH
jgi:hypothetical protein